MKRFLVLILFLLCLTALSAQEIFEQASHQLKPFFPAQENSEQATWIHRYIKHTLENRDIPYTEIPLDTLKESHSFAKNISVVLPGTTQQKLIIAVPMAEHSSPYNAALALELAVRLSRQEHTSQIEILFLGSDFIGARVAAQSLKNEDCVLLYLNFQGIPDKIMLQTGVKGHITPYWVVNYCNKYLHQANLAFNLKPEQNILYSIGMIPDPSPLDVFLEEGITALMMYGDSGKKNQSSAIWTESFCSFVETFEKQELEKHENEDQNYFIMQFGDIYYILTELHIMIFFLIVAAFILFYIILHTRQAKNYLHLFIKNFNIVFWTIIMIFIFFQISTWICGLFLLVTKLDSHWQSIIPELVSLKALISLVLLILMFPAYSQFKQHNLGNFFSGSAVITALLDMIIFMAIDFSFAVYYIWSLLCIFIFAVVKRRRVKFLCMILSGIFFIRTIYGILFYPALNLCCNLIFSPMGMNLALALFVLPFVFMGIRIFSVIPPKIELKHKVSKLLGFAAVIILTVLAFRFVYLYNPFSGKEIQLVEAVEFYDLDENRGTLTLESDYKLGSLQVKTGNDEINAFSKEKRLIYDIQKPPVETAVWTTTSQFLERKTIEFHVAAHGRPDQLNITLRAPAKNDKIILLDSTYPYQLKEDTVQFFIGKNQPMPFSMKITTQRETSFDAQVDICYSIMPFNFFFDGDNKHCKPSLILTKKLSIRGEK